MLDARVLSVEVVAPKTPDLARASCHIELFKCDSLTFKRFKLFNYKWWLRVAARESGKIAGGTAEEIDQEFAALTASF